MTKSEQEFMHCPNCFIYWSAPSALFEARRKDGGSFYCPNGHSLSWTDNENDRTRRERDRLKQENARLAEQAKAAWATAEERNTARRDAERRAAAARGQVTKLKKRAAGGACPCCNRTFPNLAAHMKTKHAGFLAEEVQAEAGVTIQ